VKLNKTFMKLKKGRYAKLTPNINPVKCYHERGKFISMDKKIATVSQTGVVTGKKKGTTYILYYMRECDKYAKCKVKVTKK
ncbi:MAG: Ig-like domain-containing protein, partial [Firmicutes bacterium]|nr:Ig-like domain-containing protein [Bacillota bacterium]